jgi:hypothetical protein
VTVSSVGETVRFVLASGTGNSGMDYEEAVVSIKLKRGDEGEESE